MMIDYKISIHLVYRSVRDTQSGGRRRSPQFGTARQPEKGTDDGLEILRCIDEGVFHRELYYQSTSTVGTWSFMIWLMLSVPRYI